MVEFDDFEINKSIKITLKSYADMQNVSFNTHTHGI